MQPKTLVRIIIAIRLFLAAEVVFALYERVWLTAFVAAAALVLTVLPTRFAERFEIRLPISFALAITVFVFATLFLGETYDFYERYWWWDLVLHAGSAIGFGLLGFLFVFMLFEGDRYAAPPIALAVIAFCVAVTIGALWEIFEFGMDQIFGLNMQKSGLVDTMADLMVDCVGAAIGASSGFFYLKRREAGGFGAMIDEFIRLNRKYFRKSDSDG